jgi:hypothetical protein
MVNPKIQNQTSNTSPFSTQMTQQENDDMQLLQAALKNGGACAAGVLMSTMGHIASKEMELLNKQNQVKAASLQQEADAANLQGKAIMSGAGSEVAMNVMDGVSSAGCAIKGTKDFNDNRKLDEKLTADIKKKDQTIGSLNSSVSAGASKPQDVHKAIEQLKNEKAELIHQRQSETSDNRDHNRAMLQGIQGVSQGISHMGGSLGKGVADSANISAKNTGDLAQQVAQTAAENAKTDADVANTANNFGQALGAIIAAQCRG